MTLIVQKYGGTSLGTPERIRRVAGKVVAQRAAGHDVVVVVSAMGDTTDELIALARSVSEDPQRRHPRELDMLLTAGERIAMALLAMAIRELGAEAISFTGSQAAIITDGVHTGARIEEVRAARVREELARGRIVIVAGFQGVSRSREVTTLGRGGSDTTAVALAAALCADRCEVYTDVDGVYTADPRVVRNARLIERIDYEEMLELACSGARVIHSRAVELASRYGIPVRVLSSFADAAAGGTLISPMERGMEELVLRGLASERGHARIVLRGLPPGMRPVSMVLSRLATCGVSVDMVAHADRPDGRRQLQITVREDALAEARAVCEELLGELGGETIEVQDGLARVALVGSGMHGRPGVYARAYEALMNEGIEVYGLSTSAISIALLVGADREADALNVLHEAFQLGLAERP
ncbi:MAG TPA: aspartate kinase [Longimicrobiales bacterium]|nr:aspartate kinase [Longimicrobiales bacterium]